MLKKAKHAQKSKNMLKKAKHAQGAKYYL